MGGPGGAGAALNTLDRADFLPVLIDGDRYVDDQGKPIRLENAEELYGAKKVTEACGKISYTGGDGMVYTYLANPAETLKAVRTLALAKEDYALLIAAAQAGTLTNEAVLGAVQGWVNNPRYKSGVAKVRAGLAARARRSEDAALNRLDHADFLPALIDGER